MSTYPESDQEERVQTIGGSAWRQHPPQTCVNDGAASQSRAIQMKSIDADAANSN